MSRFFQSRVIALGAWGIVACAVAIAFALPRTVIALGWLPGGPADDPTGSCNSGAHADAQSYDGSMSGSADNSVSASGYTAVACNGLGQTNAIFTSGLACENALIRAGGDPGIGYAIVGWTAVWQNSITGEVIVIRPDQPQQYDCHDTFS